MRIRDEVMHTKLRYKFELMELDNTIIAVPVGENANQFRGVVKLNETGAAILEMLSHDVSEEDILSELLKRYAVSEEALKSDVHQCIDIFQEKGMLS